MVYNVQNDTRSIRQLTDEELSVIDESYTMCASIGIKEVLIFYQFAVSKRTCVQLVIFKKYCTDHSGVYLTHV